MEIDDLSHRVSAILPILEKICHSSKEDDAIPLKFILPDIARELAGIWEKPERSDNTREIIFLIQKIKKQTVGLFQSLEISDNADGVVVMPGPLACAGVSPEMVSALYGVLKADVYSKAAKPRRGRPRNEAATHLAIAFARHFPMIAGIPVSASTGGRFVGTLGDIYTALGFHAKPDSYAQKAVAALKADGFK